MLTELHIENIAVIEKADIEFRSGLTVLSGETGAGKSIIIDSLDAALGARTSRELIRSGADSGVVTAVFESDNAKKWFEDNDIEPTDEIIIRRKLTADGKNNCRVCGAPVTVSQLKQLGMYLLDIHGQNDGLKLMDEDKHREYLDSFGDYDELFLQYSAEYAEYKSCKAKLKSLAMDEIEKERLSESLHYQIEELSNAQIRAGEEDELIEKRNLMRNAEKITDSLDSAYDMLYSSDDNAYSLLNQASALMMRAAQISDELKETADIIENASSLAFDAAERIRDFKDGMDFSADEYDRIETRLSLIKKLCRKYNTDEAGLISHLNECVKKLDELEYADDMLVKLKKELDIRSDSCRKSAAKLSQERRKAARELEKRIVSELHTLSMPSSRFEVSITPIESDTGFDAFGCDVVRFLISANAGEEPGRISKIASGGELSRIMLAMKTVFSKNDSVETMVFDEIDSGVSGIAAQRVGEKMSDLSRGKQVLCITHLPQIAAIADNHELITKTERGGRTYTEVIELDFDGRCRELARLHGGDHITELTLASASEQLKAADMYKTQRV